MVRQSFMTEKPDVPVPKFTELGFDADASFWVFGYGSLIWDPGFAYHDRQPAILTGYRRSFCVKSMHYRGTEEFPGLVLGLDEGESCQGCAFEISECRQTILAYLWHREMSLSPYRPLVTPVTLADGRVVQTLTFCVDRTNPLYRPFDSCQAVAEIIAQAHGKRGSCRAYLENTLSHLAEMGMDDPDMTELLAHVQAYPGNR